MFPLEVVPAKPWMPDGLSDLETEAQSRGFRNVSILVARWVDGSERYDGPGESLLVVVDPAAGAVIGVGGLTICPDVHGAMRVRRFYVAEKWRRRGIANALAQRLIMDGLRSTELLTCNAGASEATRPFWEAMGFSPANLGGVTHILRSAQHPTSATTASNRCALTFRPNRRFTSGRPGVAVVAPGARPSGPGGTSTYSGAFSSARRSGSRSASRRVADGQLCGASGSYGRPKVAMSSRASATVPAILGSDWSARRRSSVACPTVP